MDGEERPRWEAARRLDSQGRYVSIRDLGERTCSSAALAGMSLANFGVCHAALLLARFSQNQRGGGSLFLNSAQASVTSIPAVT